MKRLRDKTVKPISVIERSLSVRERDPGFPMFNLANRGRMPILIMEDGSSEAGQVPCLVRCKPKILDAVMLVGKHRVSSQHKDKGKVNDKGWLILAPGDNIYYLSDEEFNEYFEFLAINED